MIICWKIWRKGGRRTFFFFSIQPISRDHPLCPSHIPDPGLLEQSGQNLPAFLSFHSGWGRQCDSGNGGAQGGKGWRVTGVGGGHGRGAEKAPEEAVPGQRPEWGQEASRSLGPGTEDTAEADSSGKNELRIPAVAVGYGSGFAAAVVWAAAAAHIQSLAPRNFHRPPVWLKKKKKKTKTKHLSGYYCFLASILFPRRFCKVSPSWLLMFLYSRSALPSVSLLHLFLTCVLLGKNLQSDI